MQNNNQYPGRNAIAPAGICFWTLFTSLQINLTKTACFPVKRAYPVVKESREGTECVFL